MKPQNIQALCHDQRHMISGEVRGVSDMGCELFTLEGSVTPSFPRKVNVTLNLLNEASGETMNIRARVTGVTRKEGGWAYRIRWKERPELLKIA